MKKLLLKLVLLCVLLTSCGKSCEEKASEMFIRERSEVEKIKQANSAIKSAYDEKVYKAVQPILANYYGYEARSIALSMGEKELKQNKSQILELTRLVLSGAENDLAKLEREFVRACK